jgi:phosphatidylglycerol:prolipoprotein diacylglycerol transferase
VNGITINIDPVLIHIGHFALTWYSLFIIVAVLAALLFVVREAKRKGISPDEIYALAPFMLLAGVVGARLFHVIDRWDYYARNLSEILQFQQGGLAIWGAIIGGGITVVVYARLRHIPLLRLLDTLIPGLLVGLIIGRLGCIVNGDAYGGVTGLPWGFIYTNPNARIPAEFAGLPTQPYPVYEMLLNGIILLLVLKLRRRFTKDGLVFLGFLSLYSMERFVLTFVRQENQLFWGLQEAQIVALITFVVSAAAITYLIKTKAVHKEVA